MPNEQDIRPISYSEVAALLHGILFAYEKVVAELYKGEHKKLFPYIMEDMVKILGSQDLSIANSNNTLEENMEGLRKYLSNEDFLKGVSFKKIDKENYTFDIDECSFAVAGVHDILKLHGGVCPFALAVAAILSEIMKEGQYLDVKDSEYSDKGSKTNLKII